jgi:methyl-accepting chemotaxis protein
MGINSAIDMLAEKEEVDTKNKEMIALTMDNIKLMVKEAMNGNLNTQIDEAQFSDEYRELISQMNSLMREIKAPIDDCVRVMGALSKGDLTHNITHEYHGSFLEIKDAVNSTIAQLRELVENIQNTSSQVYSASSEILASTKDLSQRTEDQAASLQETASSMNELTTTVDSSANNAKEVNDKSQLANNIANKGGQIVAQVVEAMKQMEHSSKKVSEIVSVIDEISFQTNLLALNAAVEAARAGDAGKGFAVVAGEVRSLAARSSVSAKEIRELIETSVREVNTGVKLVNDAGKTLAQIVDSTGEMVSLIGNISRSSDEQASGIKEINAAVSHMDEAIQQNAALVEENTAAVHSLTEQAQDLEKMMSFFKIMSDMESPANDSDDAGRESKTA